MLLCFRDTVTLIWIEHVLVSVEDEAQNHSWHSIGKIVHSGSIWIGWLFYADWSGYVSIVHLFMSFLWMNAHIIVVFIGIFFLIIVICNHILPYGIWLL